MNTFKQKSLCAAIAAAGALGVAGTANAVYVNPEGLGQVLLYPYYTVRTDAAGNAYNTLLSVVNTTASAKAVKVRFVEGRNSAEVLDFNLFLSPKDVWVAGLVPISDTSSAPGAGGTGVYTPDKSCTNPKVSADSSAPTPFVNFVYAGDGAGDSLDRTREGYIEIIEMGDLAAGSKTAVAVTHVNGVPKCDNIDDVNAAAATTNPSGGLFGGVTIINVQSGQEFAADAVALNAFRAVGKYDLPGDIKPDLRDAVPTATVFNGSTGTVVTDTFGSGIDAVSAAIMHQDLYNEFLLAAATQSKTDWIVTMPTKRYYYNDDGTVNYLFQRNFTEDGACDDVTLGLFDREEFKVAPGFSPPPRTKTNSICWEANVITFNNSNVFASKNSLNINTTFEAGWLDLGFPIPTSNVHGAFAHFLPGNAYVFYGLPTIGFAAMTYNNGTFADSAGGKIRSTYGGTFKHRSVEVPTLGVPTAR